MGDTADGTASDDPEDVEVVNDDEPQADVNEPGKLMRIGLMLRAMQEEVRRADPDDAGRDRLRIVHRGRALPGPTLVWIALDGLGLSASRP